MGGGYPPGNLSLPLILSRMSKYQDVWGYLTDSQSSGEPPIMDRGFVPGDQSLALVGSQSEFGA